MLDGTQFKLGQISGGINKGIDVTLGKAQIDKKISKLVNEVSELEKELQAARSTEVLKEVLALKREIVQKQHVVQEFEHKIQMRSNSLQNEQERFNQLKKNLQEQKQEEANVVEEMSDLKNDQKSF